MKKTPKTPLFLSKWQTGYAGIVCIAFSDTSALVKLICCLPCHIRIITFVRSLSDIFANIVMRNDLKSKVTSAKHKWRAKIIIDQRLLR